MIPSDEICIDRKIPALIIGLNPPFGVNATLANKFIDKALEFRPKLLILIVPPETERLDKKKQPYDLVWEDNDLLSGKAFYLPGSIDSSDKRLEDWNLTAPPLSLWSHPDWTSKHMTIAQMKGHLSTRINEPYHDKNATNFVKQVTDVNNGFDTANPGVKASRNKDNINDGGDKERKRGTAEEKPSEEISVMNHLSLSGDRSASGSLGKTSANQSDYDMFEKGNTGDKKRMKQGSEEKSIPQHSSPSVNGSYVHNKPLQMHSHNDLCVEDHRNHHLVIDHEICSGTQPLPHQGYTAYETLVNTRRRSYNDDLFTRYLHVEDQSYHSYDSYLGCQDPDLFLHRDNYAPVNHGITSSYGAHLRPTEEESSYGRPPTEEESSYGRPAVNSAYTLQRYAPRLDELNRGRVKKGEISDFPVVSSGLRNESLGFGPAPNQGGYYRQSSSGWINE